jgi:hypothetical protein
MRILAPPESGTASAPLSGERRGTRDAGQKAETPQPAATRWRALRELQRDELFSTFITIGAVRS